METADVVRVFVQAPCEALRPFVKRFLVVEFPYAHKDSHLPDTGLVAAFRLKGDLALDGGIKAPQAALTGLWDTMRAHDHGRDRIGPDGKGSPVAPTDDGSLIAMVFLEARDFTEAVKIAETHPGLHYGVSVEVRAWTSPLAPPAVSRQ